MVLRAVIYTAFFFPMFFCSAAVPLPAADTVSSGSASVDSSGSILSIQSLSPCLMREIRDLRSFIEDRRFDSLRARGGDIRAVDAIYLRALAIAGYDIQRALFLSLTAVLEHRTLDLRMPAVHSLALPLTFETKEKFFLRKKHLPKKLYRDSPATKDGDVDKAQHFFASAYLSYVSDAPDYVRMLGDGTEWAEPILVIGGENDPRDRRANGQGMLFGRDLISDEILLPSDYLTLPFQDRK
jgi:hypothetical protein